MYPSDNYYNKKGKYLGSDGIGTTVRLMDIDVLQDELSFNTFMKASKAGDVDVVKLREGISRKITFKNEGQKYQNMYNDSKDDAERSTVIILDVENAEIRTLGLEIGEVGGNSSKTYHTGTRFGNRVVLGNVHTHQQEEKWMKEGASDYALFESQYETPQSDGQTAEKYKDNIYSIGRDNINYYSPDGKGHSSNNVGSRKNLESGKLNIGKHALQKYGQQHYKK